MTQPFKRSEPWIENLRCRLTSPEASRELLPRMPADHPLPPRVPGGNDFSAEGLARRRHFLEEQGFELHGLDLPPALDPAGLRGNIENLIGACQLPVGIIGPLRIIGLHANGDYYVPLATSEGAMVASYHRGATAISQAGGATTACIADAVARAPCFLFDSLLEAGRFLTWVHDQIERFPELVAGTTRHGRLIDMKTSLNGSNVYLIFEYTTGDAAGQNMVTAATQAICEYIVAESPITPRQWFVEGNLSGDKKASMLSFLGVRGKKVVTEVTLPTRIVERYLHATPASMAEYCKTSAYGGIQSGGIGVQGHIANALAGLFIACGQDAACVSEASIGITAMDVTAAGDLHVSLSLPNLIVGTVGGGTHLPSAQACLRILGCLGDGSARCFAEICAATAMAGEISIIAALASGDFARAHATYRHRPKES